MTVDKDTRRRSRRDVLKLGSGLAALGMGLAAGARSPRAQSTPYRIGFLSDMSGLVADLSGAGSVVSAEFALEDFGGRVLGRPVEILKADHHNKPDEGIGIARKWYDDGVQAIFDIGITSVAIGVQALAKEKNKSVIFISSSSADLTGKFCSQNGIHWNHNSYSQAVGAIRHAIASGNKTFFFMTVDYAYGHTVQRDTTAMIEELGGKVVGSALHTFETTDFSSDLLKAQASGAKVIALATTSSHAPNIIKQSDEFGIRPAQTLAPLSITLHDVKAMGLPVAHGVLETTTYYWDQNDATRAYAKRFFARFGRMPNMIQASAYGAVKHYLTAVAAAGSDDATAIMQKMHATPVNDFMSHDVRIRSDGQVLRDHFVLEVKTPAESKGEWDLYKVLEPLPAAQAYPRQNPAVCSLT